MIELSTRIPDAEVLLVLVLVPEDLAGKMLFLLRAGAQRMFHVGTLRSELWSQALTGWHQYPQNRREEVDPAIAEALAWLEAHALIVPAEDPNGQNGGRHLSRHARRFENETAFTDYRTRPSAEGPAASVGCHHGLAVVHAWGLRNGGVRSDAGGEIAVRRAAGYADSAHGMSMMKKVFNPESGPLTDYSVDIAALSGLSVRTIQRVKRGDATGFDTRHAIVRAFGFEDINALNRCPMSTSS